MPDRDLSWHRAQAMALDMGGVRKALQGRLKRGDFRAAILYLEHQYQLAPTPDAALQLGQMHMRCRSYPAGLWHLQQAIKRWPDDLALVRLAAEMAMLAQDFTSAAPLWHKIIAQKNAQGPYPVLRAIACLRQTGQARHADDVITRHATVLRHSMERAGVQMLRRGADRLPRGLYLVSGNNGTGKSTLGHLLHALGYPIIDADTEIASFCLHRHFSDVRHDLRRRSPESDALIRWAWPDSRVTERFAKARKRREAVFVIGGFGKTVVPYRDRFRQIFHLCAPDHVIADRLAARSSINHKPGSKGYQAALQRNSREQQPDYAATILSADRPPWAICAELLSAIDRTPANQSRALERT